MKFVSEPKVVEKGEVLEDIKKEKVQLGNVETKPADRPRRSESWVDGITTTLVNLRENPDIKSRVLDQIRGGEIVKINASINLAGFKQVKYGTKEGYIKSEYVKEI